VIGFSWGLCVITVAVAALLVIVLVRVAVSVTLVLLCLYVALRRELARTPEERAAWRPSVGRTSWR
jgi:hypothetical protein